MEKRFNHPLVGELTVQYERLSVAGDPGLEIFIYVAEPGSRSAESFTLLANWAALGSTSSPSSMWMATGESLGAWRGSSAVGGYRDEVAGDSG
jgi:hypothetical protein